MDYNRLQSIIMDYIDIKATRIIIHFLALFSFSPTSYEHQFYEVMSDFTRYDYEDQICLSLPD